MGNQFFSSERAIQHSPSFNSSEILSRSKEHNSKPVFGYWIWFITDSSLYWSPSFYQLLNIPQNESPDFYLWNKILCPKDLLIFCDSIENVLQDFEPREIIVEPQFAEFDSQTLKCKFVHFKRNDKNYIMGICEKLR